MILSKPEYVRLCRTISATIVTVIALLLCVQENAHAQATQVIYDDQLENGWQNWSWDSTNLSNTSPVHSGFDSLAATDTTGYGGVWLHPAADMSTTGYFSVTFWINPGPVASQTLQVTGVSANSTANNTVGLPSPLVANTWTKETITLATLGVANISNYAGFWLQSTSSSPSPTYYLDDITLDPITAVSVNVNSSTSLNTIPSNPVGINTAVWDGYLTDSNTLPLLQAAGVTMLRYPAGSGSDVYHWATNSNVQPGNTFNWNSSSAFDPFMTIVSKPLGAQQIITTNYGSNEDASGGGDPAEAAAWVQYANITKGYGIKYWEVGNEVYGNGYYASYWDWEYDLHDLDQTAADRVGAPSLSPVTYGTNVATYAAAMKAVDPTIRVGAVLNLPGEGPGLAGTGSNNLPLLDWDSNVLQQCGSSIGFVILHWYPEFDTDNDSVLLSDTSQIASWASQTQSLINQYCGSNAPNVQIIVDELNSDAGNPGKQMLSTVNALFMADNFQTWLENGAANADYWDLRNGAGNGDDDSSLFGTLQYGDEGALSNGSSTVVGGVTYTEPAVDTPFPAYYAIQMIHYLGSPGDTMVSSTSSQALVTSHAVKRADGSVGVLLINKDPIDTFSTTVTIPNFTAGTTGTIYTYGPGTTSITSTSFSPSSTISLSLPPYTMETLSISAPPQVPAPVITPASGTYPQPLYITINDSLVGSTIWYTTDGSDPLTSSTAQSKLVTVYDGNVSIRTYTSMTVRAAATETGYRNSASVSATYNVLPIIPTPVITPASGTYFGPVSVSISESQTTATVLYTTDGTDPATSSTAQTYSAPFTVSHSGYVFAVAVQTGYTNSLEPFAQYTIAVPTPIISPASGAYSGTVPVTISDSLAGATIKYTTDGTDPLTSFTAQQYSAQFNLTSSATVKAIAFETGYANSADSSAVYTINAAVPTPIIYPGAGTYNGSVGVQLLDTLSTATIKYTTDGTDPATSATALTYAPPYVIVASSETLTVVAENAGYSNSTEVSAAYTIVPLAPFPVISPTPGTYVGSVQVKITDSAPSSTILYTTDGSNAATSSTAQTYIGPITLTSSATVNAVANAPGYATSGQSGATYTVTSQVPTPLVTPASGTYVGSVTMTVTDSLAGVTIKYTGDGTDPATSASARTYTSPLTFTRGVTATIVAMKTGYANSAEPKVSYTITAGSTAPTPVISPAAGTYVSSVPVTISDSLGTATIKYTTDGTNPATSGTALTYSGQFTLTASATVEAVAIASGSANSGVASSAYTIQQPAPTPIISPSSGSFSAPVPVTITDSLSGATIKYTTDGTNPATSGTAVVYSGQFTLTASATVTAIATKTGYAPSALATASYTITVGSIVPTPVISPGTGSYSKSVTQSVSESLSGVTLKYTTDGSDPATNPNARTYTGALTFTRGATFKVVGIKAGYANSAEPSATITITP